MAKIDRRIAADQSAGLFTIALIVALVVLALLGHFGLPDKALGIFLAAGLLTTYLAAAFVARTMDGAAFFVAGRSVSAVANGMSTAVMFLSGGVFFGLAGAYFADIRVALALTLGWSFGFLLLAVLIAPYFRRSGAFGVAGFLAIRYGGRMIRMVAVIIIAISLTGALAATFATAAWIGRVQFGLHETVSMGAVLALTAATTLLGGMRSTTAVGMIQYITLAIAVLVPAILISTARFSLPVPQVAFGLALQGSAQIVAETGHDLAQALTGRLHHSAGQGFFGFLATVATLATGVAVLPHIVMRSATVANGDTARRSVGWSLAFILVVILTAPAYAAFARFGLLADLSGSAVTNLPAWIFDYGRQGLVRICGEAAESRFAVITACRGAGDATANFNTADVALSTDAVMVMWPSIMGLPQIMTVLLAAGALSATVAAAAAIAIALANAVGHDLFGRVVTSRSSAGRRLIVTRIALIVALVGGAWIAGRWQDDVLSLAHSAISLSAGGLFPAMVLAIWWRRANLAGAVAGMISGFLVSLAIYLQATDATFLPLPDMAPWGLTPMSSGFVGVLVGFAVMTVVSLVTPPPDAGRLSILDALRRPGDTPIAGPIAANERD